MDCLKNTPPGLLRIEKEFEDAKLMKNQGVQVEQIMDDLSQSYIQKWNVSITVEPNHFMDIAKSANIQIYFHKDFPFVGPRIYFVENI